MHSIFNFLISDAAKANKRGFFPDKPIEVSFIDGCFKIRDWGLGLEKEEVIALYTSARPLLNNPHSDLLDLVCLNSLIIHTYLEDGCCYVYCISKDSEGKAVVTLWDKYPSRNPTGTEVAFYMDWGPKTSYYDFYKAVALITPSCLISIQKNALKPIWFKESIIGEYSIRFKNLTIDCCIYGQGFLDEEEIWLTSEDGAVECLSNKPRFLGSNSLNFPVNFWHRRFSPHDPSNLTIVARLDSTRDKLNDRDLSKLLVKIKEKAFKVFLPFVRNTYKSYLNQTRLDSVGTLLSKIKPHLQFPESLRLSDNKLCLELKLSAKKGLHSEDLRGFTVTVDISENDPKEALSYSADDKRITVYLLHQVFEAKYVCESKLFLGHESFKFKGASSVFYTHLPNGLRLSICFCPHEILCYDYVLISYKDSPPVTPELIQELTGKDPNTICAMVLQEEHYLSFKEDFSKLLENLENLTQIIHLKRS